MKKSFYILQIDGMTTDIYNLCPSISLFPRVPQFFNYYAFWIEKNGVSNL